MIKITATSLYMEKTLVPVKEWKFPTGESGTEISDIKTIEEAAYIDIEFVWEGDESVIKLLQVVEIINNYTASPIHLYMPYLPYSRQDRRCKPGESHSLKVFAQLINSCNFHSVKTDDVHSYVPEALINNFHNVSQADCAIGLRKYDYLIAPDAGAAKKIEEVAKNVSGGKYLTCHKKRDDIHTVTIKLEEGTSLNHQFVCVVDDLCDGGATFIGVAQAIRNKYNPPLLDLYVTHGFFTKGISELAKHYDNIYVANLYNEDHVVQSFVKEI